MYLSCYFAWKWSDKNIITILAVVCSFVVPSCFQTLSEDLESSEKFTNCPEDLESSGEFSTIPGSFRSARKLFGCLLANSVCCSGFHEALEFSKPGKEVFCVMVPRASYQACFVLGRREFYVLEVY